MNKYISRGLMGVFITGGLTLLGATAANAADTSGDDGAASGSQAVISITLPITLGGNAISVIGDSTQSNGAAPAAPPAASVNPPATTSGKGSIAGGTQALVDVAVPVTVSGNAISVLGDSSSTGAPAAAPEGSQAGQGPSSNGDHGILGGTQVLPRIAAPVTVSGNAISVLGDSRSGGSSSDGEVGTDGGGAAEAGILGNSGTGGLLGGTQILAGLMVPLDVSGNAVSVIGDATTPSLTPAAEPGIESDPTPSNLPDSTGVAAVSAAGTTSLSVLASTGAAPALAAMFATLLLLAGLAAKRVARVRRA